MNVERPCLGCLRGSKINLCKSQGQDMSFRNINHKEEEQTSTSKFGHWSSYLPPTSFDKWCIKGVALQMIGTSNKQMRSDFSFQDVPRDSHASFQYVEFNLVRICENAFASLGVFCISYLLAKSGFNSFETKAPAFRLRPCLPASLKEFWNDASLSA